MINPPRPVVDDTEANRQICRKYCRICPNYTHHRLDQYQPGELFCACGTSQVPTKKEIKCFCPACEIFTRHHLNIGYFCVK